MAWIRCCGGTNKIKDLAIVKDKQALYPFTGGGAQTASGVRFRIYDTSGGWVADSVKFSNIDCSKYNYLVAVIENLTFTYGNAMILTVNGANYSHTGASARFTQIVDLQGASTLTALFALSGSLGTGYVTELYLTNDYPSV